MEISGDRLRKLRTRRFLTQVELASEAGLTESTINRLEQGLQKARISTVRKIANVLGVNPEELLNNEERAQDES